jgi:endonuclease/exonuclease/phosphatase family metal-dependent hydrolase
MHACANPQRIRVGGILRCALAALLLACATRDPATLRLLTWNVGNPDTRDPDYALRIADQGYEDFVRDRIAELAPDAVFLQEVLAPARCASFVERDASRTCHDASGREPPVRRLLGPDYSIVCDARRHVGCVGIHTAFGTIDGVAPGALVLDGAETSALPLAACDWLRGDCGDERCDAESSVSTLRVQTRRGPVRLVHVHLTAPAKSGSRVFWGEPCRHEQLRQAFAAASGGEGGGAAAPSVIAGDFNLDPSRLIGRRESDLWTQNVGEDRRYRDLTPRAPDGTRYATRRGGLGIATDHVLASRATGDCTVHGRGVGPDPGTEPLDAGFDWSRLPGAARHPARIDHFAITCELVLGFED